MGKQMPRVVAALSSEIERAARSVRRSAQRADVDDYRQSLHEVALRAHARANASGNVRAYVARAVWNGVRELQAERHRPDALMHRNHDVAVERAAGMSQPEGYLESRACLRLLERRLSPDSARLLLEAVRGRQRELAEDEGVSPAVIRQRVLRARTAARQVLDADAP